MKGIDFAKAAGAAVLVLAIDLACAFIAVGVYSLAIDPGHTQEYYMAAAQPVSTLSTRVAGPLLFAAVVWLFSRKRPDRSPWIFALVVFGFYFVIDWALIAFSLAFLNLSVLLTMALKLGGALVGAALAEPARKA